jgi:EAL domain-containing protein (putative c-di-GMP-specific phosphodiesterase class I)
VLAASGFSPDRLKLEITESVFFEHQDRAIEMLNTLRSTGIQINIDDFGTGYSNLGYLKRLPITALKIDRSFVAMIDEEGNHDEIVKTIVTLARNIGLRVVAEGVETPTQLQLLKELGCEGAQGYFLAPPMNLASLRQFLGMDATYNLLTPEFGDISTVPLLH